MRCEVRDFLDVIFVIGALFTLLITMCIGLVIVVDIYKTNRGGRG